MQRTLLLLVLVLVPGCHAKPGNEIPAEPESLTLFSIDGIGLWKGTTTGEMLYGCPVLGRVEITDPTQRRQVLASVKGAIQNASGPTHGCWLPRHVLRVVSGGQQLDVVICFECRSYRSYRAETESARVGSGLISDEAQALLNEVLAKAGVDVVPSPRAK